MILRDTDALIRFLDSRQSLPHAWGRRLGNDCVAFALDAVEAQTGIRVAPQLNWTSRASALRVLRIYGSIEAAFDAHFERVAPAHAMRGDIAGVPDAEFGIHPMIVEGATLVCPGDDGNRRGPRSAMVIAWSAVQQKAPADV